MFDSRARRQEATSRAAVEKIPPLVLPMTCNDNTAISGCLPAKANQLELKSKLESGLGNFDASPLAKCPVLEIFCNAYSDNPVAAFIPLDLLDCASAETPSKRD